MMDVVDYFELKELPGRTMFRCERRQATLQVNSCADMWRIANDRGAPERLDLCKNCPLGAKHAGVSEVSLSPIRGASICARCHQGTTRLIRKHLCISCYNRQREYLIGRNAKGSVPKMHPPLYRMEIRFKAGDQVRVLAMDHVVGTSELVMAALRDTQKQVTFGMCAKRDVIPQMDLFC